MNNSIILFIIEGEKTEEKFLDAMKKTFFKNRDFEIISLPAKQNIYMLFETMKADGFDTDVIEVLREQSDEKNQKKLSGISRKDIAEVYLLFDYDIHQNNSHDEEALYEMLKVFDNETENGKLYISYPMVEALYDYKEGKCEAFSDCFIDIDKLSEYKGYAGRDNPNSSKRLGILEWGDILNIFPVKLRCLFDTECISYEYYRKNINPLEIFMKQEKIRRDKNQVFVLSAFPELLFDYHPKNFWIKFAKQEKFVFSECMKKKSS